MQQPQGMLIMAKKLDRNKPFGVVQGEHNAAFEQDGVLFDIDGNEIVLAKAADTEPVAQEVAPAKKPGGRANKAADPEPVAAQAAVDEQLAAQGAE